MQSLAQLEGALEGMASPQYRVAARSSSLITSVDASLKKSTKRLEENLGRLEASFADEKRAQANNLGEIKHHMREIEAKFGADEESLERKIRIMQRESQLRHRDAEADSCHVLELERELKQLSQGTSAMKGELVDAKRGISTLESEVASVEREGAKHQKQIDRLRADLDALKSDLQCRPKEDHTSSVQLQDTFDANEMLQEEIATLQSDLLRARRDAENLRSREEEMIQREATWKEERGVLAASLGEAQAKERELQAQLTAAQAALGEAFKRGRDGERAKQRCERMRASSLQAEMEHMARELRMAREVSSQMDDASSLRKELEEERRRREEGELNLLKETREKDMLKARVDMLQGLLFKGEVAGKLEREEDGQEQHPGWEGAGATKELSPRSFIPSQLPSLFYPLPININLYCYAWRL
ncbi:unnamed protein product [Chrysoparadoxa australica]